MSSNITSEIVGAAEHPQNFFCLSEIYAAESRIENGKAAVFPRIGPGSARP
jgi:hypothetical protein